MKKTVQTVIFAAALAMLSSCTFVRISSPGMLASKSSIVGNENLTTKTFDVPQFNAIKADMHADLHFSVTNGEPFVTVRTSDNLVDKLNIKVQDGCLLLSLEDEASYSYRTMDITLGAATLNSLKINGAGDFDLEGGLDCTSLDILVRGAGDVEMDSVRCEGKLSIEINGAGDVDIKRLECAEVEASINGAGDIDLSGRADRAVLSIKGAGDIDISRLDVAQVTSDVKGVGRVKRK